jgi:Lipoprotein signal peptidase
MNSNLFKKITIFVSALVLIFFLDRISKIYILQLALKSEGINIYINQFLSFNLVWNKGIAFGLFSFEKSAIYNFITSIIVIINLIILYLAFIYKDIRAYFFYRYTWRFPR